MLMECRGVAHGAGVPRRQPVDHTFAPFKHSGNSPRFAVAQTRPEERVGVVVGSRIGCLRGDAGAVCHTPAPPSYRAKRGLPKAYATKRRLLHPHRYP